MKQVGPVQFASFLERINIPTHVDPYPSIALGTCDLSLYEMMWGYTIFPGRGFSTKPSFISRIEDRNGNVIKRFDYSQNRKESISELTAYKMTRMMEGPVTVGTAAGLMQRLGAKEMGGKTGTTNDNADAWFMGYVPQLLAGTWIGCDDRFIRIESGLGYGGQAARPLWEAFFKKVYADKSLGIDREASFPKPADLFNEMGNANPLEVNPFAPPPGAEGDDYGSGSADEYGLDTSFNNIGAESKAPVEENGPPKKTNNKPDTVATKAPKIGSPQQEEKKKKGIINKIFGKKDKNEESPQNDY
jgi:penicillin-binding protein 1A